MQWAQGHWLAAQNLEAEAEKAWHAQDYRPAQERYAQARQKYEQVRVEAEQERLRQTLREETDEARTQVIAAKEAAESEGAVAIHVVQSARVATPSSLMLLGMGMLGMAGYSWRRRSKRSCHSVDRGCNG